MFVHTIKASFFRKRKPADYEGCDVSAEVTATLEEGEDYRVKLREIADETAIVVYQRIGMPSNAVPVFAGLKATTIVDNGTATQTVVETAAPKAETPAAEKKAGRPALTEEQKAANAAARAAEKAKEGKPAADRGQIATNPENRVDPATGIPEETAPKAPAPAAPKATDGIPEETAAPKAAAKKVEAPASEGLTGAELQSLVQKYVVIEKKITPLAVKGIFKTVAGVELMQEMTDAAVRLKVKQAIEAAVGGSDLMAGL